MKRVELVFKSCSEHFKHHFCNLQCNLKSPAAINITALQTFYFSCLLHFGNKFYQKFLLLWILWGNFINPLWAPPTFFSLPSPSYNPHESICGWKVLFLHSTMMNNALLHSLSLGSTLLKFDFNFLFVCFQLRNLSKCLSYKSVFAWYLITKFYDLFVLAFLRKFSQCRVKFLLCF